MKNKEERMTILEELEGGLISPEEAAEKLQEDPEALLNELESPMDVLEALEGGKISTDQAARKLGSGKSGHHEEMRDFPDMDIIDAKERVNTDSLWMFLIAIGVVTLGLSVAWMSSRLTGTAGMDLWFFVAWLPFAFGLFLIVIGWMSKVSPWLRIRVRSKKSGGSFRLNFGFPIPKGILKWGIQRSGKISDSGISVMELEGIFNRIETGNLEEPIVIRVDDDDDDVEIVIG